MDYSKIHHALKNCPGKYVPGCNKCAYANRMSTTCVHSMLSDAADAMQELAEMAGIGLFPMVTDLGKETAVSTVDPDNDIPIKSRDQSQLQPGMSVEAFAEYLDCCPIGKEIDRQEEAFAARNGFVVVFGYSDDCIEFRGAIDDEVGCYNGGKILVTKTGVLQTPDCGQDECPHFAIAKRAAKEITAKWCETDDACWTFETGIPHETFEVFEDETLYCVGIVFSTEDLT